LPFFLAAVATLFLQLATIAAFGSLSQPDFFAMISFQVVPVYGGFGRPSGSSASHFGGGDNPFLGFDTILIAGVLILGWRVETFLGMIYSKKNQHPAGLTPPDALRGHRPQPVVQLFSAVSRQTLESLGEIAAPLIAC
jgi:hypothetical protein